MSVQSRLSQLWPADLDCRRVALVGGLSLAALAGAWWVKNRLTNELPPGPFAWPLLGSLSTLSVKGERACTELPDELYRQYGAAATLYLGRHPSVLVLEPRCVQEGLVSPHLSDRSMPQYSIVRLTEQLNSIFLSPASERWRYHRKVSHAALREFAGTQQLEQQLVHAFDTVADSLAAAQPQQLLDKVYAVTYTFMTGVTLSEDFAADQQLQRVRAAMDSLNELVSSGVLADLLPSLRHLPLPSHRRLFSAVDFLVDWARDKCSSRQRTFAHGDRNDILDFLVQEQLAAAKAGKGHLFQDVHLRQTLLDIFLAGADTTASIVYYAIRALCLHPQHQQRCYEEVCSVFGRDGTPSCSERHRLPFTDAFLHEVMRYWTVAPFIPRQCSEDTTLCGYRIRKGTMVFLCIGRCHLDESVFPNARQFDPGHFLQSDGSLSPYQRGFLPFGAGSRVCLGESIAKKTVFLLLLLLLQRFSFSWAGEESAGGWGYSDESTIFFATPKKFLAKVERR